MADHLPRTEDDRYPVPHRPPKKPKYLPVPPPMPKVEEPPMWPVLAAVVLTLVAAFLFFLWHAFTQTFGVNR